ncbi:hypothetical protein DXD84_11555 [Dorea formicigenerans]|jgi:hypothetical protein|uniref:Uncharacterized protein n=1 Tax=Dorea formicigenerans TaxID=39486 RepID=A0A3E4MGH7_9FIRM|nr:hypothetical protein [Dorea formicigenerans]RGI82319.1 hypothetical protein DXD84_11555 [Dorea formicigenerans]RGI87299.1 hypothetical protein DXD82_09000 [Dorea formicigenerans]RGK48918.1 hypothetical protein DXD10_06315 [Dorea formicigenerans]
MLELMLDRHVIYVLMGMSAFAGVVSKVVVGRTLRKLVAAAESMGKSNHPLMRLVRAKFEHTCMISEKVENVGVFVDKYLYEYRVGGVRLHAWRRLQMAGAGLCLILGGVGAIISYRIKGATEQTAMIGGTGVALALIVFLVHMLTDEEYRLEAVRNYMVDYLENIYQHRYEKTYKKEVLAEEARSEEARIAESARTQENAGMTKNTRMPEEARMGENTRMPEEARIRENTRMPENAGTAEGDNLPGESVNQKKQKPKQEPKQESKQEFPGSMDSLLWAMYKTEPLQVEDDRKVKKTAISQKTGKTEKIEKTIESEETKAQDEANRNQRIREILEEFMA